MLGTALASSGRLDESIAAFEEALKHAGDRIARANAHYGMGEACHRKGARVEALHDLDLALREVGFPRPRTVPGFLLDTFRAAVAFHVLPSRIRLSSPDDDRERRLRIACVTHSRIFQATGMWNVLQYMHGAYRFASFARQTNDPELLHYAYSKFSLNTGMFSLARLSRHYLRLAEKAAESCRSSYITATAKAHIGCADYFSGRLDEAATDLHAAVPTLDKAGEWFGLFAHHVLRHIHGIRGDGASELREADWEIATGRREVIRRRSPGDSTARPMSSPGQGDFEEAVELASTSVASLLARESWNTIGIGGSVLSFARLQASDYAGARQRGRAARSTSVRALCVYEFVGDVFPLLVESLLGPRWAEREGGPARGVARKAWRESRVARFAGWLYPNYGPHALRVSGRAAFALGKTRQAARYLERAIVAAERLGARYDLARSLLDASRVIPEKAEDYRRRGQRLLDELGAVVPEAERRPS